MSYLGVDFVETIVSRRVPLSTQMLEILRIVVQGRAFQVPFKDIGGLEKLERLRDDGLDLRLDLYDWDERVLLAHALPFHSEDD